MQKHKSERKRLGEILPMSPLFVGFCAYGLVFWFLFFWIWFIAGQHRSTMKYVVLGPALGPEPGDRYRKIAGRWYLFVRNYR